MLNASHGPGPVLGPRETKMNKALPSGSSQVHVGSRHQPICHEKMPCYSRRGETPENHREEEEEEGYD